MADGLGKPTVDDFQCFFPPETQRFSHLTKGSGPALSQEQLSCSLTLRSNKRLLSGASRETLHIEQRGAPAITGDFARVSETFPGPAGSSVLPFPTFLACPHPKLCGMKRGQQAPHRAH